MLARLGPMAAAAEDEVEVDVEADEQGFLLTLESRVFVKNRAYFLFVTAREKMAELWRKSGRKIPKAYRNAML